MINLHTECRDIILHNDIEFKCNKTYELYQNWQDGKVVLSETPLIESIQSPGRPEKPLLVSPLHVAKRGLGSKEGYAGLFHALAHIEYNAIHLALDACYRFQNMPYEYYSNWLSVARDEVYHFGLLKEHLASLGYSYGDFTAHNGLWDMAHRTEADVLFRMALVPRVLEARGLDAIPEIRNKVLHMKDMRGAEILAIINRDEITHVKYGDVWFKYLCDQRNLNYDETFFKILDDYDAPKVRGAFNREDRKQAGFSDSELNKLKLR